MIDFVDIVQELVSDQQYLVITDERAGNSFTAIDIKHRDDGWSKYRLLVYPNGHVLCAIAPGEPGNRIVFSLDLFHPDSITKLCSEIRKLTIRL